MSSSSEDDSDASSSGSESESETDSDSGSDSDSQAPRGAEKKVAEEEQKEAEPPPSPRVPPAGAALACKVSTAFVGICDRTGFASSVSNLSWRRTGERYPVHLHLPFLPERTPGYQTKILFSMNTCILFAVWYEYNQETLRVSFFQLFQVRPETSRTPYG